MNMTITVSDKVVLVTGGAQGIGKAFASELTKSGAKVALADISQKINDAVSEIRSNGGTCVGFKADVSREEDANRMVEQTVNEYGRVDVLVNNAALFSGLVSKPFQEITVDEWDKVMAVNLRGMFLCCRAAFPQMKAQGKGKIINISSGTFLRGATDLLHYVTSKGGVVGMTRALARELGQYKITVNAIAPGLTVTEAAKGVHRNTEHMNYVINQRALKREEVPEDLTGTLIYLCSDASDFVSGQLIAVNGGDNLH